MREGVNAISEFESIVSTAMNDGGRRWQDGGKHAFTAFKYVTSNM